MISRVHSFLLNIHGHWEVRDNRSVNGIFVNDRKVQEAVLKDGDVVVFGGGGDHPIGAIIEQPDSEFRYEFKINTSWNAKSSKDMQVLAEEDSEDDTLDGGSDSRNPTDHLIFEMENNVPSPASCVTLDTSATLPAPPTASSSLLTPTKSSKDTSDNLSKSPSNESSSTSRPSSSDPDAPQRTPEGQSNSKKSKEPRSPHSILVPSSSSSPMDRNSSSNSKLTSSASVSSHSSGEWPSGPETKKVFLGPAPTPDSLHRPVLSANQHHHHHHAIQDIEGVALSSATGDGTNDELRQSESSSAANQADAASSTSAGQEHELDEESKARIAHLQAELHQACEERRRLAPIYRTPDDSHLMCKLCRNLIFNPTTMGCGHTFCDSCVEFLVIENPKCPECGASVAPPIISSMTLKQEVILVVREWSRADQAAWVTYMTRRNEAIRYAGLELLLESFRARGVRFVNIEERWSDADRYAFAEGIDVYSSNSRMAFCRAVGLTSEWVQNANFDTLLLALGNLGLNLTVPIIRARARAALLPYDGLQDDEEEDTQRFWSDSSSSSSSSSDDQNAKMRDIEEEIALQRGDTDILEVNLDEDEEEVNKSTRSFSSRSGLIIDEAELLEKENSELENRDHEEEGLGSASRCKKCSKPPRRLSAVKPEVAVPPALLPTANLGELDTPIGSARRPEKIPEEAEDSACEKDASNRMDIASSSDQAASSTMDVDARPTAVDENGALDSSSAGATQPTADSQNGVITFHDLIVEAMREEILQYIIQNRRQFMYYQAAQRQRLYHGQPGHPIYHHHHHHHHHHGAAGANAGGGILPIVANAVQAGNAQGEAQAGGDAQQQRGDNGAAGAAGGAGGGGGAENANAPVAPTAQRHYHLGARLGREGLATGASPLQPLHQILTDLQSAQRVQPPAAPNTPVPPIFIRARPPQLQVQQQNAPQHAAGHDRPHRHHRGHHAHANDPQPLAPQAPQAPHAQDQGHLLLQPDQPPAAQPDLVHAQVLPRQPAAPRDAQGGNEGPAPDHTDR